MQTDQRNRLDGCEMQESVDKTVEALCTRGERYLSFGEVAAAEAPLKEALEKDSTCTRAWFLLGRVYEEQGKYPKAHQCYSEAERGGQSCTSALARRGLVEMRLGMQGEARRTVQDYIERGGREPEVLLEIARAAFAHEDCETVLKVTQVLVEEDENLYEAWEMRGICQAKLSRFNAACLSLNMAIEGHPESIGALNTVGHLCYEGGNYKRALEFYETSLSISDDQPYILFRYGTALWMVGRWQEALMYLERYVEVAPYDPHGWNNLGVVYRERGEIKRAMECYARALELDPTLEAARHNMETAEDRQVVL